MAVINLAENSLKPNKPQGYPQGPNGTSLWAFLLSIFIYISIFYSFNLSPSSLLNTTKFWFFISNTLILIIAADSGAFSSSKTQSDLYEEEYLKKSRANSISSFESQYQQPPPLHHFIKTRTETKEDKSKFPENKLEIVVENDLKREKIPECIPEVDDEAREEKKDEVQCVHSMSNKGERVIDSENKIIPSGSEAENEEENEFSTMSDEELRRRVEEFIQRFNRQIRIQAVQNRVQKQDLYLGSLANVGK